MTRVSPFFFLNVTSMTRDFAKVCTSSLVHIELIRLIERRVFLAVDDLKPILENVAKLGAEFGKAAKQPDVIQKLEQGKVVVGSTPEELRKLVAREVPAWKKIVQETGIKMEE